MMKPLNFYIKNAINEKLDINKVNVENRNFVKKFPMDGGFEEIRKYLLKNGFQEVDDKGNFDNYTARLNSAANKVCSFSAITCQIRFADTTYDTINEKNLIFAIGTKENLLSTELNFWWEHKLTKKEFYNKLKERFDF